MLNPNFASTFTWWAVVTEEEEGPLKIFFVPGRRNLLLSVSSVATSALSKSATPDIVHPLDQTNYQGCPLHNYAGSPIPWADHLPITLSRLLGLPGLSSPDAFVLNALNPGIIPIKQVCSKNSSVVYARLPYGSIDVIPSSSPEVRSGDFKPWLKKGVETEMLDKSVDLSTSLRYKLRPGSALSRCFIWHDFVAAIMCVLQPSYSGADASEVTPLVTSYKKVCLPNKSLLKRRAPWTSPDSSYYSMDEYCAMRFAPLQAKYQATALFKADDGAAGTNWNLALTTLENSDTSSFSGSWRNNAVMIMSFEMSAGSILELISQTSQPVHPDLNFLSNFWLGRSSNRFKAGHLEHIFRRSHPSGREQFAGFLKSYHSLVDFSFGAKIDLNSNHINSTDYRFADGSLPRTLQPLDALLRDISGKPFFTFVEQGQEYHGTAAYLKARRLDLSPKYSSLGWPVFCLASVDGQRVDRDAFNREGASALADAEAHALNELLNPGLPADIQDVANSLKNGDPTLDSLDMADLALSLRERKVKKFF